LALYASLQLSATSPQFYPPVCYQPSQAEGLSLLRAHLPPGTTYSLPSVSACLGLPANSRDDVGLPWLSLLAWTWTHPS